jgi:hypothetical protein
MPTSRITRGVSASFAIAALLALAPLVAAQEDTPEPMCALTSADEVSAVAGAPFTLNENSSAFYCSLGSDPLTISLVPETELEPMKADFGGGGEDLTVAGLPAWWQESSGNFLVAANGSVLFLNGWHVAETAADKVAILTALAELIVPRVPPPADPEVAARLTSLIPATIGTEAVDVFIVPGWYLVGTAATSRPEAQTLHDLLAGQGMSSADLVLAAGTASSGSSAVLATVPGLDAASLRTPLLSAIVPTAGTAASSTVELGGKQVTRIETEPVTHAYASGDAVALAYGSDDFLTSFFSSLP